MTSTASSDQPWGPSADQQLAEFAVAPAPPLAELDVTAMRAGIAARERAWRGEFDVLAALRRAAPTHSRTAGELHGTLMVTTGASTKQVGRLLARDLVTRTVAPEDHARAGSRSPDTGQRRLVDGCLDVPLAVERDLLAGLTVEQRAQLAEQLARLAEHLEAATGRSAV